jgi:hypothetical protein
MYAISIALSIVYFQQYCALKVIFASFFSRPLTFSFFACFCFPTKITNLTPINNKTNAINLSLTHNQPWHFRFVDEFPKVIWESLANEIF